MSEVTFESRGAIARAGFFLARAEKCPAEDRVEFESFLESAIVFARTALHRFQKKHRAHAAWKGWWNSLAGDPAVEFFRHERDWILKEGPTKVGQRVWIAGVVGRTPGGESVPEGGAYQPELASEFYYYDQDPTIPATATVETHLSALEALLEDAEKRVFI
jgi:hypothetical protein